MSLDLAKLEKVKRRGDIVQCRCPACAESGLDKTGNHLRIYPDGRFGCALQPKDTEHRRRIWELCKGAEPIKREPRRVEPEAAPKINVTQIMHEWREKTQPEWIAKLGLQLGVSAVALASLGCAWSAPHRAWAWPMFDGYYEPVGIRLRTAEGKKFAVTGSHQGLFLPDVKASKELMICEGPSDTSAALSVGMFAIGRPSCLGCEGFVNDFVRKAGVTSVVICSDNDKAGQAGAEKLQATLRVRSVIYTPPCKDAREFVNMGGTREMINSSIKDLLWTVPR